MLARWSLGLGVFGVVVALAGAGFTVFSGSTAFDFINRLFDPIFWSAGHAPDAAATAFRAWVYGAWGASLAGWGITIAALALVPIRGGERWAWWTVALSTIAWFVLDEGVSVAHGVWPNIVLNAVLLVVAAFLLGGAGRAMRAERER
jgi:hypothetical protein